MKLTILAALCILTASSGEVQIPIQDIRSITYDKTSGSEMRVNTASGMRSYAVHDIVKITLSDVPEPTALESINPEDARDAQKVLKDGTVYVVKDGQIYTLKGEKVQ